VAIEDKPNKSVRIKSYLEERELLSKQIKENFHAADFVKILEAGCGRRWPLDISGLNYHLTGVDLDRDAIESRKKNEKDLDEVYIGDLRSIQLEKESYDVIYNSFVLEHIKCAERVLDNFFKWLKPNGILILKIPERDCVFSFITRITPHWFHVFYYRYIIKRKNAGKPGYGPYPTFHDRIVSQKGIKGYCKKHGYMILGTYTSNLRVDSLNSFSKMIIKMVEIVSFSKFISDYCCITFVIKKRKFNG